MMRTGKSKWNICMTSNFAIGGLYVIFEVCVAAALLTVAVGFAFVIKAFVESFRRPGK